MEGNQIQPFSDLLAQNGYHREISDISTMSYENVRSTKKTHQHDHQDSHLRLNSQSQSQSRRTRNNKENCQIVMQPIFSQICTAIPEYSLGRFLQGIHLSDGTGHQFYNFCKISRFPHSQFIFTDINKDMSSYSLKSNLTGSIYNLYKQGNNLMTIKFDTQWSFSLNSVRGYSMYCLSDCSMYEWLDGFTKELDLSGLYSIGDNRHKIRKFRSRRAVISQETNCFALNFGNEIVQPSVKNAILVDEMGKDTIKIYKTNINCFEVAYDKSIKRQWIYALTLASLDFKIAVQ